MKVDNLRYKDICRNCHKHVNKNKLPPQNITNGLQLDAMSDCLKKLSDLESVLVAKKILFLKIFEMPKGSMPGFVDKVVLVPGIANPSIFCFLSHYLNKH